jgi:WD40 repeat protein
VSWLTTTYSAASGHLGQLVVWEWQSETFVLKQQVLGLMSAAILNFHSFFSLFIKGHEHAINSLDYSPDGALIVTGGVSKKQLLSSPFHASHTHAHAHTTSIVGRCKTKAVEYANGKTLLVGCATLSFGRLTSRVVCRVSVL